MKPYPLGSFEKKNMLFTDFLSMRRMDIMNHIMAQLKKSSEQKV
jgi:hypothetical protein